MYFEMDFSKCNGKCKMKQWEWRMQQPKIALHLSFDPTNKKNPTAQTQLQFFTYWKKRKTKQSLGGINLKS